MVVENSATSTILNVVVRTSQPRVRLFSGRFHHTLRSNCIQSDSHTPRVIMNRSLALAIFGIAVSSLPAFVQTPKEPASKEKPEVLAARAEEVFQAH